MKYLIRESQLKPLMWKYFNSSLFDKWRELAPIVEIVAYEKVDVLNNMFGDLWRPIFIKWFEDLFSLSIKTLKH